MRLEEAIKKAQVLIEALPYLKKFHKKIFVIKYGGSILSEERVRNMVLEDMVFLAFSGIRPVLVHGGGPHISERLKKEGIKNEFYDGMRRTDEKTLKIVEEELDNINDLIVEEFRQMKALCQGFKSKDGVLFAQRKKEPQDLGFVGTVVKVDTEKILKACENHFIPVISPMAVSLEGPGILNVNADEAAFKISSSLKAEKLIFFTNAPGIMRSLEDEDSLISTVSEREAEGLISEGVISEGMVPKVRFACEALKSGVSKVHIVDARLSHSLLLEIFTDEGVGTEIVR